MNKKSLIFSAIITFISSLVFAETERSSIIVSGRCVRSAQPDQVEILVGVQQRHLEAQKAIAAVAPIYEKLLKSTKALNLKNTEFMTTQMSVNKIFDYVRNQRVEKGFEARYGFSVTTSDIVRVGEIFKIAKDHGANSVQGPFFGLSKALFKKEYEACLDEAVRNARAKAEIMAKSVGSELSGKANVHEIDNGQVYMAKGSRGMDEMAAAESSAPTVESKKEDVQVNVNATFFLK